MKKHVDPARNTCAPQHALSASCIRWGSIKLINVPAESVECDPRLSEIIMQLDCVIKGLRDSIELGDYNSPCTKKVNGVNWTAATLIKSLDSRLCSLVGIVNTIKTTVDNYNFGNQPANINLSCLTPANCNTRLTYNQVLELFAATICRLQEDVTRALQALNLLPGGSNTIYIPSI